MLSQALLQSRACRTQLPLRAVASSRAVGSPQRKPEGDPSFSPPPPRDADADAPTAALVLGYSGLIPFVGGAGLLLSGQAEGLGLDPTALVFMERAYGSAILRCAPFRQSAQMGNVTGLWPDWRARCPAATPTHALSGRLPRSSFLGGVHWGRVVRSDEMGVPMQPSSASAGLTWSVTPSLLAFGGVRRACPAPPPHVAKHPARPLPPPMLASAVDFAP